MKSLFRTLPPFAPDYSGVGSALFELGGLLVMMDASGCTGNYTGYDEPRWFGSSSKVFSSGLREIDAVLGDEEKLAYKIQQCVTESPCKFVALMGSPVPMVIGTDYRAVAAELSQSLGIPVLSFNTSGMHWYDIGVSAAFLELARNFVKPGAPQTGNGVNILGAIPLDVGHSSNLDELKRVLEREGYAVISCWAMGARLDEISAAATAKVNIVISVSGLQVARYMEQEFGIPYVTGIPVGHKGAAKFLHTLKITMAGRKPELHTFLPAHSKLGSILIIGEQVMGNSIRDCLQHDMGYKDVDVASYFSMDDSLRQPGDVKLTTEEDLTDITGKKQYALIIGDPLYKNLVAGSNGGMFGEFPHIALSSKLYWNQRYNYIGEAGIAMISRWLQPARM